MIHEMRIEQDDLTNQKPKACFPYPKSLTVRIANLVELGTKVRRAGMVTGASCMMRENKAKRLEDGAKGNARKADTDEVGVL